MRPPFQLRFPSDSDSDSKEGCDCECDYSDPNGTTSSTVPEMLAAALRRSLVLCSAGGGGGFAGSPDASPAMVIGRPTDVRHVSHVTFDRFDGFLGLPAELEPQLPRPAPSASISVFGVSPNSMQCSYDTRGNSVPTILLAVQRHLYQQGGLQAEGIFRITAESSQDVYVRDQLNSGIVPDGVDSHCLAGLIKAWFRELPTGVLDTLTPEQVMHCNTEEECALLARMLAPTEAALLDWAINLMADVVEHERYNKMNARNIAMVFAPNMTQMADPLTALIHAVQVMNFLKTLILRTIRERLESDAANRVGQTNSESPGHKDEPYTSHPLEQSKLISSERILAQSRIAWNTDNNFLFSSDHSTELCTIGSQQGSETQRAQYEHERDCTAVLPADSNFGGPNNESRKIYLNGDPEGISNRFSLREGVVRLCRRPVLQFSRSFKKAKYIGVVDTSQEAAQTWV